LWNILHKVDIYVNKFNKYIADILLIFVKNSLGPISITVPSITLNQKIDYLAADEIKK